MPKSTILHFLSQPLEKDVEKKTTKCCDTCSMNNYGCNCKMWHWAFVEGSIDLNAMCCKEDWEGK